MAGAALAWVSYVPVPGVSYLVARRAPLDRLVRFHARQAAAVILVGYFMLLLFGLLMRTMPEARAVGGPAAGAVLAVTLLGILTGIAGAARGRYTRVRPFWDLMARA